jgi:hypothetical protein
MSAAHVETLFRELCAHCADALPWLSPALTAALAEEALVHVPASEAQLDLMREIRACTATRDELLDLSHLDTLDALVAGAAPGPLYFNLVVIVYPVWSKDYRAFLSSVGSLPSTPESTEESSDEDLRSMRTAAHAGTRRTGVARPARPAARTDSNLPALLAALRMTHAN